MPRRRCNGAFISDIPPIFISGPSPPQSTSPSVLPTCPTATFLHPASHREISANQTSSPTPSAPARAAPETSTAPTCNSAPALATKYTGPSPTESSAHPPRPTSGRTPLPVLASIPSNESRYRPPIAPREIILTRVFHNARPDPDKIPLPSPVAPHTAPSPPRTH